MHQILSTKMRPILGRLTYASPTRHPTPIHARKRGLVAVHSQHLSTDLLFEHLRSSYEQLRPSDRQVKGSWDNGWMDKERYIDLVVHR